MDGRESCASAQHDSPGSLRTQLRRGEAAWTGILPAALDWRCPAGLSV